MISVKSHSLFPSNHFLIKFDNNERLFLDLDSYCMQEKHIYMHLDTIPFKNNTQARLSNIAELPGSILIALLINSSA